MNYGMWDISRLLEQWSCAKTKGSRTANTLSTMQKECSAVINGTLSMSSLYVITLETELTLRDRFPIKTGTDELPQLRDEGG